MNIQPKERPILFSGEMVRAILDGRKTMTRRIVQVQPPSDKFQLATLADSTAREDRKHIGAHHWAIVKNLSIIEDHGKYFRCPYGKPGDRLWVRETWAHVGQQGALSGYIRYKADEVKAFGAFGAQKWTSSIFMPRAASRITLEITGVRVERLQDISEADAIAEGITEALSEDTLSGGAASPELPEHFTPYRHKFGFKFLWNQINGKRASWASNPWVWVIEFCRASC